MTEKDRAFQKIVVENEELRARLIDAETAIQAIRSGEVDAVVVNGSDGEKIYTLTGADRTYHILVDAMSEGALILSHAGVITYCNRTFATMLQMPMGNVLGQSIFSFVSEDESLRNMLEQYRSGSSRKEFSLKGNGHNAVHALFAIGRLENDEQSVSVIVTDLTERKQAEDKLENYRMHLEDLVDERTKELMKAKIDLTRYYREASERLAELQTILEQAPFAVWIAGDRECKMITGNSYANKLFGVSLGDNISQSAPNDGAAVKYRVFRNKVELHLEDLPVQRAAVTGQSVPAFEAVILFEDGRILQMILAAVPLLDLNGHIRGSVAVGTNITELKQAEEKIMLRKNELEIAYKEIESFSYSVSHDLRAPLRAIDGFSDVLQEDYKDKLDACGQDYLNRIRKAAQQMSQLIDGMLSLSRITRADIHPEYINLSSLVRLAFDDLKKLDPDRKAELIVIQEVFALADGTLIKSLVQNLVENAWKFSAENQATRIEFGVIKGDYDMPVYFVKDNGIGFDMKYADKLFQPFSRLHHQNDYQGTGIGLANAEKIVKRHNGSIWADGEIGKGATFYFTLGGLMK